MTDQITLEEALKLVEFERHPEGWLVQNVRGIIWGSVDGGVRGSVRGSVGCNVQGNVRGDVEGDVWGTINGRSWKFAESPREKLERLVKEGADKDELLAAINQLEG